MNTSLSFLATDSRQLPKPGAYGNNAVEAVIFQREHLDDAWKSAWDNTAKAVSLYGNRFVTFHFPMNDCDFVDNPEIFQRLCEAYRRASDLGLSGLVVHSNKIKTVKEWNRLDIVEERLKVVDALMKVCSKVETKGTWLGLENMPLIGNEGYELDPLFCFAEDFKVLPDEISIVWDVCHAVSSIMYTKLLDESSDFSGLRLRPARPKDFDFKIALPSIRHWHFASFRGVNNPVRGTSCFEGVLPSEGTPDPKIFEDILGIIKSSSATDTNVNFEVQENDYSNRRRGPEIIEWAKQILGNDS